MLLKRISLVFFLFLNILCFSQKKKVSVKITQMEPYCGGARPTKEIQEQAQTPKPYNNKTIIVISESGKVDSAKTNSLGILKLKLKPGKYKLFEAWRYNKRIPAGFSVKDADLSCLKEEWQKEAFSITVDSKKTDITSKNAIIIYCPWTIPCLIESARPPVPQ